MALSLRMVLVVSAFVVLCLMIRKIRQSQIQTLDAFFWMSFSCSFVILAAFPELAAALSRFFGFQAASNFVFVYVISVLVIRDFSMTLKFAKLRDRFDALVQEVALRDHGDR